MLDGPPLLPGEAQSVEAAAAEFTSDMIQLGSDSSQPHLGLAKARNFAKQHPGPAANILRAIMYGGGAAQP